MRPLLTAFALACGLSVALPSAQVRLPIRVVDAGGASAVSDDAHPRCMWTATEYHADIPTVADVRAKIEASAMLTARLEEMVTYLDGKTGDTPSGSASTIATGYAFLAQLFAGGAKVAGLTPANSAATYGAEAVEWSMAVVEGGIGYLQEAYFDGFPIVYPLDWAWDYFTTEQRQTYSDYIEAGAVTGHWGLGVTTKSHSFQNGSISMAHYAVQGAAILAEAGYSDVFWDAITDDYAGIVSGDTGTIGSWSAHGGNTDAAVTEGFNYFQYTNDQGILAAECHRTSFNLRKATFYNASDYSQYVYGSRLMSYMLLPYGQTGGSCIYANSGTCIGFWRSNYSVGWQDGLNPQNLMHFTPAITAGILKDVDANMAGLHMWLVRERVHVDGSGGNGGQIGTVGVFGWSMRAITSDETIASLSPDDLSLPLSYNFPTGYNVYRASMEDETNGHWMVTFNTTEWTTASARGREPTKLIGHFTVDRKGPQISMRGSRSHSGVNSGGFNRMTFPKINRTRTDTWPASGGYTDDMGDIRSAIANGAAETAADFVQDSLADYMSATRFHNASGSRDVDYAYADYGRAYATNDTDDDYNIARVDRASTDFVVFRTGDSGDDPVQIVRMDRWALLGTGTYEPTFVVNYGGDPAVTGGTGGSAGPSRNGTTHCFTQYGTATTITSTQTDGFDYDGKAVTRILAPSSRVVIKMGGPNENGYEWNNKDSGSAEDATAHSCEWVDLYGIRNAPTSDPTGSLGCPGSKDYTTCTNAPDMGFYGVEIKDDSAASSGYFLMTHEVGASGMTPSTVVDWSGTYAVARIGNRAASFPTDGSVTSSGGTIIASTTCTDCRLLVTGQSLNASRTVSYGSNITNVSVVGGSALSSGGTVTTDAAGGDFYIEFDVTGAGSGANNTITIATPAPDPFVPVAMFGLLAVGHWTRQRSLSW